MKLISFSVQNYRSITKARQLPISDLTVLIGPNNEGKSNILRAMVTVLKIAENLERIRLYKGRLRSSTGFLREVYDWERDFPMSLQSSKPDGESVFNLEFELDAGEILEFRREIRSSLNGSLPVQITIGQQDPGFKIMKRGPGGPALSSKAEQIAKFIGKRFKLEYIPTVRTAGTSLRIVEDLVARELLAIQEQPDFKSALEQIARLQQPILDSISESITGTLREFLPNVEKVEVKLSEEAVSRAFRRSCELIVDDGSATALMQKGDGVQSLAALGLIRHSAEKGASGKFLILAIEEPESHLHPRAIHRLKGVLGDISRKYQVIITTHCPLFVNRSNLKSNILVTKGRAKPATNTADIRKSLGVKSADNLRNAELVLIVEGEDDRKSLEAILRALSIQLKNAFESGLIAIDSLLGGSNLSYKLSQIRDSLASHYVYLDNDDAGRNAVERAEADGLLEVADYTLTTCQGMPNSEFEDILAPDFYKNMVQAKFGVDIEVIQFRGNKKWVERIRSTFQNQGKNWNDRLEKQVKEAICELIQGNPKECLDPQKVGSINALVRTLEEKIMKLAAQ